MHTILVEDKRKKKKSAPGGFLLVRKPTFASPMLGLFFLVTRTIKKKKNKNKNTSTPKSRMVSCPPHEPEC